MGIFNKFFTAKKKELRQPFVSTITERLTGVYSANNTFLSEYRNWVYACVNARAEDVASIQLKLMKGDEEVFEHPILDLINRVNPLMTKEDLFNATQSFKDLDGNAYWYLVRDGEKEDSEIKEIYMLRPDKMRIVVDKTNPLQIFGYIYKIDARSEIPFKPSEILHFKNFNPTGNHPFPHKGMGIVEASLWAINSDNEARQWNFNFFKKSARPDGILYQDGDGVSSPEEHKRLQEEWAETYQGSENSHKVAILSGGLKWQEIQRSQKDMDFINQRTFSRDEILALFRVPKSIIGITDDVNRANAEAAIYVFALRTIKPLMQKMVDTLNEFLIPSFGDSDLYFTFVSPVPSDRVALTNEYSLGIDRWISRNEIRANEGLPPTENGDSLFGTFSSVPIDTVLPEKVKSAKPVKKTNKKKSLVEKSIDSFISRLPEKKEIIERTISEDVKTKYISTWKEMIEVNAGGLKKKLVKYFNAQEKEVISNLSSEFKGLEAKEFKLKALSDVLFDEDDAVSAGISLITPFIKDYIKQSGEQASALVGIDFDSTTVALEKFIKARAKYFAETINQTTADDILNTLKDGTDNGETLQELSQRIADVYDKAVDYRTDVIARTEVSASANEASKQAYEQAGVKEWQWVVVNPQDEDCKINDGQIVKIGEEFNDGSVQPPDPHPNCECATIPVF